MKAETLKGWQLQIDAMIATLDKANYANGLIPKEKQVLATLKGASVHLEEAVSEREQASRSIRIPPGHGGSSALDRRP